MTISDKISMVHDVLCQGEYQMDVAKRYQVTQAMVSKLVNKVKANPDFLDELIQKRDDDIARRKHIADKIQELNNEDQVISSIP